MGSNKYRVYVFDDESGECVETRTFSDRRQAWTFLHSLDDKDCWGRLYLTSLGFNAEDLQRLCESLAGGEWFFSTKDGQDMICNEAGESCSFADHQLRLVPEAFELGDIDGVLALPSLLTFLAGNED